MSCIWKLPNTPPRILYNKVIPRIEYQLNRILASNEESYEGGMGYWDGERRFQIAPWSFAAKSYLLTDYCLAQFLLGTALSFAAFPVSTT